MGNYRGNEAIEFGPTPQRDSSARSISADRSGNEAGDKERNRPATQALVYIGLIGHRKMINIRVMICKKFSLELMSNSPIVIVEHRYINEPLYKITRFSI